MDPPGNIVNPYSNYGGIVSGSRFIGRKKELKFFTDRIFSSPYPQDIAIIGAPKIGKSSLVYEAIIARKSELIANKKIPIWINMGIYDTPETFFGAMVFRTYVELNELGFISDEIKNSYNKISEVKTSAEETFFYIEKFFKTLKTKGLSIIFIFDEFDHARKLFKGNISGFQKLRELTYNPDWKTSHITISRRTLRDIEHQSEAISNYYSLFHEYPLVSYDSNDMVEYFKKMDSCTIELSQSQRDQIEHYCGTHPYLLDIVCYEIVENIDKKLNFTIENVIQSNENLFHNYYENMIEHLNESESFEKVIQVLFGPLINVNRADISRLKKYGLLSQDKDNPIVSTSQDFNEYLFLIQRNIELWPLLSQVERGLRKLITDQMIKKYGPNWIDQLSQTHPKLRPKFKISLDSQLMELKYFGKASKNLLDYTYIGILFTIIFLEWNNFQTFFGKDEKYWGQCQEAIIKIRNPLAHFRDEVPPDSHKKIADGYCSEIIEILHRENIETL